MHNSPTTLNQQYSSQAETVGARSPVPSFSSLIHRLAQSTTFAANLGGMVAGIGSQVVYGSGLSGAASPAEPPFVDMVGKACDAEGFLRALELVANRLEGNLQYIDSQLEGIRSSL